MLNVVRKAEQALVQDTRRSKEYLPIGGNPEVRLCPLGQPPPGRSPAALTCPVHFAGLLSSNMLRRCRVQFCRLTARLAFGEHSGVLREKRNATVQSLSGTGSLRVCAALRRERVQPYAHSDALWYAPVPETLDTAQVGSEFLAKHSPGAAIYLPTPTWCALQRLECK